MVILYLLQSQCRDWEKISIGPTGDFKVGLHLPAEDTSYQFLVKTPLRWTITYRNWPRPGWLNCPNSLLNTSLMLRKQRKVLPPLGKDVSSDGAGLNIFYSENATHRQTIDDHYVFCIRNMVSLMSSTKPAVCIMFSVALTSTGDVVTCSPAR